MGVSMFSSSTEEDGPSHITFSLPFVRRHRLSFFQRFRLFGLFLATRRGVVFFQ